MIVPFDVLYADVGERILEYFLDLVRVDSPAAHQTGEYKRPSSEGQTQMLRLLAMKLASLGLTPEIVDSNLYVTLPASPEVEADPFGLIAHVDSSPETRGTGIEPRVIEYDGGEITYPKGLPGLTLDAKFSPALLTHVGRKIIVTSGDTLLSSDDKSGVTVAMLVLEYLLQHPEVAHPEITVLFTCDEEIGHGVDGVDAGRLPLRLYTLDGGDPNIVEDETFHALQAMIAITGVSAHPGMGGTGVLLNGPEIMARLIASIDIHDVPRFSSERQGFYHVVRNNSEGSNALAEIIIRDFTVEGCDRRAKQLQAAAAELVAFYQDHKLVIDIQINTQYPNMKSGLDAHPEVVERALEAISASGLQPKRGVIRGGTDGSRLTIEMGHPCPNLGVGERNFHSPREWVGLDDMVRALQNVIHLCGVYVTHGKTDA